MGSSPRQHGWIGNRPRFIKDSTGYTDNFLGEGKEAILFHGSKRARLDIGDVAEYDQHTLSYTGRLLSEGKRVRIDELNIWLKELYHVDLGKNDTPLHFLACYSKRHAQILADSLNRPVVGYSKHAITTSLFEKIESQEFKISAHLRKHDIRRFFGKSSHSPNTRIYYPRNI